MDVICSRVDNTAAEEHWIRLGNQEYRVTCNIQLHSHKACAVVGKYILQSSGITLLPLLVKETRNIVTHFSVSLQVLVPAILNLTIPLLVTAKSN